MKSHEIESKAFSKSTKMNRPLEFSYSDSLKMSIEVLLGCANLKLRHMKPLSGDTFR